MIITKDRIEAAIAAMDKDAKELTRDQIIEVLNESMDEQDLMDIIAWGCKGVNEMDDAELATWVWETTDGEYDKLDEYSISPEFVVGDSVRINDRLSGLIVREGVIPQSITTSGSNVCGSSKARSNPGAVGFVVKQYATKNDGSWTSTLWPTDLWISKLDSIEMIDAPTD